MAAAISAGDLAEAMSRANVSAQLAGSSLDNYIGYVTTVADVTQKSASSVGESFKTLYSRFQNVAAGKFVASQEDMEAEDYDEQNFEALNDIEKVYSEIGINLRDSVNSFRDIDDILSDLAEKWDTLDSVTQSAVATSTAGTRQRENFLVLMENWDSVSKYAKIAENSYGTALNKMEAFTDSIEAAQNRITSAVEKWALALNQSDTIKGFYNALAGAIENIHILSGIILTLITAFNMNTIVLGVQKGFINLTATLSKLSIGYETLFNNMGNMRTFLTQQRGEMGQVANEEFIWAQQQLYLGALRRRTSSLDQETQNSLISIQNSMLGMEIEKKKQLADFLLGNLSEQEAQARSGGLISLIDNNTYNAILNTITQEEIATKVNALTIANAANNMTREAIEAQAKDTLVTEKLIALKEQYGLVLGKNISNSAQLGTVNQAAGRGVIMGASGLFGGIAGQQLGSMIGGTSGSMIGSVLGGLGGSILPSILSSLGLGTVGSIIGGPVAMGIVAAIAGIINKQKKDEEERIKKVQEEFKEVTQNYQDSLSASVDVDKYDELVKGVDSFGNNVSLTNEEYQEFLDISNKLSEKFPELVVKTDEAGNAFLGMNGKVGEVTDSVNDLLESLQKEADMKMLSDEVFGEQLKNNNNTKNSLEKEKNKLENKIETNESLLSNPNHEMTYSLREKYTQEIEDAKERLKEIEDELLNLDDNYSDQVQGIIRNNEKLETSYKNLTEEEKNFIDILGQSISLDGITDADIAIDKISNTLQEAIENIPDIKESLDIYFNLNSQMPAQEYIDARNQLLSNILTNMGDLIEETDGQLLIKLGFALDDDGNWYDTTNPLNAIYNEGLDKKLNDISKDYLSNSYSIEDLQIVYEMLKDSIDDAVFSLDNFNQALYKKKYENSSLSSLAQSYENLVSRNGPLSHVQEIQKSIIENQLDNWAKQLGVTEGKYNDIIEKVKTIGDLTYGGVSTKTPEEVMQQGEDYEKFIDYLNNDYEGEWDPDTLTSMMNYEDLLPYISNNDISGLKGKIKEFLGDIENTYKQSYENILYDNEEVTKATLKNNSDLVDAYAENYNIDLNNFNTLKEAETWINSYTTSLMTQDYNTWWQRMSEYYKLDSENFTTAAEAKIAMNAAILDSIQGMNMLNAQGEVVIANEDELKNKFWQSGGRAGTGMSYEDFIKKESFNIQIANRSSQIIDQAQKDLQTIIDKVLSEGFKTTISSAGSSSDSGNDSGDDWTYDDELDAKEQLIDKEWEAMEAYDELTKTATKTKYFDKMASLLNQKIDYYNQRLKDGNLKISERYDYEQKLIEAQKALNNLDDEEIEDEMNLAELKGYSLQTMMKMQKEYIDSADTEEELVERQKEYNDLLKEEYDLKRDIRQFERDFMDTALERQSGQAYSDPELYDQLTELKRNSLQEDAQAALERIEIAKQQAYKTLIEEGYSDKEAQYLATKAEDVREATQEYLDAISEQAQLTIDSVNDKLDEIQKNIDLLNDSKPKEWTSIDQIKDFSENTIGMLEKKIPILQEALSDTSMMTDEQVQDLVDQLNEITISLHEAQIEMRESIKEYQESQYDAIVSKVQEYQDELQDQIDAIEKEYDDLITPLEEANKERERAIELEDLLRAKQEAAKEKERVYREGK